MENRKRNVQIIIRVTEEEWVLIEEKMQQIPTLNLSAYARKMLIDGYIITLDVCFRPAFPAPWTVTILYQSFRYRTVYRILIRIPVNWK